MFVVNSLPKKNIIEIKSLTTPDVCTNNLLTLDSDVGESD